MFQHLLAWPDQLPGLGTPGITALETAAILMRLRRFVHAEAVILAHSAKPSLKQHSWRWLFILLALYQRRLEAAQLAFEEFAVDHSNPEDRFLQAQLWLETGQLDQLHALPMDWWNDQRQFPLLGITHICYLITTSRHQEAEQVASLFPSELCPELMRCHATIAAIRKDFQAAADWSTRAAARYRSHVNLQAEAVKYLIDARSRDRTIPVFREVLNLHGEQPEFLESAAIIKLLQREPAQARRCHLMLHAYDSVRTVPHNPSGLINSYEQTGCVSWMPYLHPALLNQPVLASTVQHNLCMFLASLDPQLAEAHVRRQVRRLTEVPEFRQFAQAGSPVRPVQDDCSDDSLTIAWLTGDLVHHPVSRFLLGFFNASIGKLSHRHVLVDLKDHKTESVADRFDGIPSLSRLEVGRLSPSEKLAAVRNLQPHLAIDLSGWTDGNFVTGFMARMAPVQVNYLGYFASTGVPAMDAWLGDSQLFPQPMVEWHEEEIVRLPRCFIAWQPPEPLPEASVQVADALGGGGIRFGSFNHNRKLSDPTLRLWGRILAAIPGSRLVLKANHHGDEATQILLRRRMLRQGLDPEQVIWLPITASNEDHLHQYGQMDVALDCFPNGGCTTTCEALWMGVPVITLTGTSYVSRMSTAVLHGAGLPQFCAANQEHYLELAIEQAANLRWLRQNRGFWRQALQTNPLGDAADLMHHLEHCFSGLYRRACRASEAMEA